MKILLVLISLALLGVGNVFADDNIAELTIEGKETTVEETPANNQESLYQQFSPIEPKETLEFQLQGVDDPNLSNPLNRQNNTGTFYITFNNQCYKPVYIAVRHHQKSFCLVPPCPQWKTEGWWHLEGLEDLRSQNKHLVRSGNRYWYFHARSTDGSSVWSGNDNSSRVNGSETVYGFRKMHYGGNSGGWHVVKLTCNSS